MASVAASEPSAASAALAVPVTAGGGSLDSTVSKGIEPSDDGADIQHTRGTGRTDKVLAKLEHNHARHRATLKARDDYVLAANMGGEGREAEESRELIEEVRA